MNQVPNRVTRPCARCWSPPTAAAPPRPRKTPSVAIRLGIAQGADWVEIDVQEARRRDSRRTARHRSPTGLRRPPRRLGAGPSGLGQAGGRGLVLAGISAGEPIPTLAEVLDLARGRIGLNIELKHHGHEQRLVEGILDLVRAAGMGGDCLLTSVDLGALRRVKALAPQMRIGWIVDADPGDPRSLELDALSLHLPLATPGLVRACRAARVETHVWTVNDRADMIRLIRLGVTSIITDSPAVLRQILAEGG